MNWLVLAAIAVGASAATAQEPSASRDDVNTTMRIIIDPNADTPDDVLRKIAAAKPKRSGKSTDSLAKDLASPGQEEPDDGGSPADPDTPTGPGTPDPTTPTPDPAPHGGGSGGGRGPDVGGLGHQVSDDAKNHGEDVRRHHDKPPGKPHDKPPHHPGSHPPATPPPPPTAPPRNPRPPGHQPPGHQPPDRHPPKPG